MKAIIGITANVSGQNNSLNKLYSVAVARAGGIPVMLGYGEECPDELVEMCSGYIFSGGGDIDPSYYFEDRMAECGESDPNRDEPEVELFLRLYKTKKPILAICRGSQLVNVVLGGTLYQDIPTQVKTELSHMMTGSSSEYSHPVDIEEDTPLWRIVGGDCMEVNSVHHQAVKELALGLMPMAYAPDGLTEAFYDTVHPYLYGYQWHPERLIDKDKENLAIFLDFVRAASGEANE